MEFFDQWFKCNIHLYFSVITEANFPKMTTTKPRMDTWALSQYWYVIKHNSYAQKYNRYKTEYEVFIYDDLFHSSVSSIIISWQIGNHIPDRVQFKIKIKQTWFKGASRIQANDLDESRNSQATDPIKPPAKHNCETSQKTRSKTQTFIWILHHQHVALTTAEQINSL